jgi:hypothetical protein
MCLFTDTRKCKVAKRDITVYKYVAKRVRILDPRFENNLVKQDDLDYWQRYSHDFVWVSPYRLASKVIYNIGGTITDDSFQKATARKDGASEFFIVERGLHAYADETDAVIRANTFVGTDCGSGVLECIIPKGTHYWVSENRKEYCTETLMVKSLSYEAFMD